MNTESAKNGPKDYEIPCQLLPVTEFDLSQAISAEQWGKVPAGGLLRDELLHEAVEWDFSQAYSDPSPAENLSFLFDNLKKELNLSDTALAQIHFGVPRLPSRSVLPEIELAINQFIGLVKQFSPYVAMGLWLVQAFFSRRQCDQLLVARVVGMLEERGLAEAETVVIKEMAKKELSCLGLAVEKADWGSNQVVEILARELPAPKETAGQETIKKLVNRIEELVAFFPAWEFEKKTFGCSVKVPLPDNRYHRVNVISKGKDKAGRQLVEFQAVCGKVKPAFLEEILRHSGRLQLGNFSIRKVDHQEYFFLQHRLRIEEMTQSSLHRILPYLAEQAGKLEAQLGGE